MFVSLLIILSCILFSNNAIANGTATVALIDEEPKAVVNEPKKEEKESEGGFWSWLSAGGSSLAKKQEEKKFTISEAIELAQSGNVDAQIFLGYSYLYGANNVEINYPEAFKYYSMAAAQHNSVGMNNLGSMYYGGIGVHRDINTAVKLFKEAAKAGNIEAATNLGFILISSSSEKNKQNAIPYFEMAAQGGDNAAKFMLGYSLYTGKYSPKDYARAVPFIKESANAGFDEAQEVMAEIYIKGLGVPQNYSKAVEYLRRAISQGSVDSMVKLADILVDGKKYASNPHMAHVFYNLASVRGAVNAAENRNKVEQKMKIEEVLKAQSVAASYQEKPSELTTYIRQTYGSDVSSFIK